jgi:hypothetical protein
VDTYQERPFGSTPSSGRKVLSANRTLTRAPDRRLGQIKCKLLLCSSADSATATRRRGRIDRHRYRGTHRPGGIRRPGCPLAATNVCPNVCRIRQPTLPGLFRAEAPPRLGRAPTEREPRSHCFDLTHQVRGRAAKRARQRRGHIFPPRRMEASGEVAVVLPAPAGAIASFSRAPEVLGEDGGRGSRRNNAEHPWAVRERMIPTNPVTPTRVPQPDAAGLLPATTPRRDKEG